MRELKIGEEITLKCVAIPKEVIPSCDGCVFEDLDDSCIGACRSHIRTDGEDIIYKEVVKR